MQLSERGDWRRLAVAAQSWSDRGMLSDVDEDHRDYARRNFARRNFERANTPERVMALLDRVMDLERAAAMADDYLNKHGDPIAAHITLYEVLRKPW